MNELDIELPEGYRMTELGPLPEEWEVVRLGDVARISGGGSAPQGDEYFKGEKPFIRVSHIDNEDCVIRQYDLINDKAVQDYNLKLFPKGTIVFPKSGATVYLEKRAMLPTDAYVVSHLCTVIADEKNATQDFLFYLLRELKLAKEKADGYPTLNISEIREIIFALPPLPEQQKIAAVLSTIQEAKERTEAVISATRDLKNSMMKYLFTYGPVPLPEAENVPLKETEIGMIPEEWEVVRLGDVAEFNLGRTPKRVNESYWDDGKYPWVSIADMSDFGYIYDTKEKVSQKAYEEVFKERLVPKETLLMSFKLTIGRTSILKTDAFHNEAIISIRPNNNQVLKEFLFYFLPTIDFSNYYDNVVKGKTLNSAKIKKLLISLPPLSTQQKIASILSAIDEKIEAEENKKKALDDLFNTLLHDLMTAKIRVNHLDLDEIELSV